MEKKLFSKAEGVLLSAAIGGLLGVGATRIIRNLVERLEEKRTYRPINWDARRSSAGMQEELGKQKPKKTRY